MSFGIDGVPSKYSLDLAQAQPAAGRAATAVTDGSAQQI